MSSTIIRLAIQKSGRLSEKSHELIDECDIHYSKSSRGLRTLAANFPIEFLYLRDDDIPEYVADGVADIGIVGENVVVEKQKPVEIRERLGFSKCRLSLAVPKDRNYNGPQDLHGMSIATSYPVILRQFLAQHNVPAKAHVISGSVEIAPSIGLADAICDIVSTGSTLLSNGLKEVEQIFKSEAVLIATPGLTNEKRAILEKLLLRIRAVQRAQNYRYIMMNSPNDRVDDVIALLPGLKSPTVVPLAISNWSALHTVVNEDVFWETIEKLKELGVEGILVIPIEKMFA